MGKIRPTDNDIRILHNRGLRPSQIAKAIGYGTSYVRKRLGGMGIKLVNESGKLATNNIWEMDEERRRELFISRAARGAAATRRANEMVHISEPLGRVISDVRAKMDERDGR